GPYSYVWSTVPNQVGSTANQLTSGSYSVVVTDGNGCTANASTIVGSEADLIVSVVPGSIVHNCSAGISTGQATLTASGGVAPYQYSSDGVSYSSSNLITGLPSGNNTVYVKDS